MTNIRVVVQGNGVIRVVGADTQDKVMTSSSGQTVTPVKGAQVYIGAPAVAPVTVSATGTPGPAGVAAGNALNVESYPVTAITSWTQTHNFDHYPTVTLIDSTGVEVEAGYEYPSAHQVYIEFPTPFSGTITLS